MDTTIRYATDVALSNSEDSSVIIITKPAHPEKRLVRATNNNRDFCEIMMCSICFVNLQYDKLTQSGIDFSAPCVTYRLVSKTICYIRHESTIAPQILTRTCVTTAQTTEIEIDEESNEELSLTASITCVTHSYSYSYS